MLPYYDSFQLFNHYSLGNLDVESYMVSAIMINVFFCLGESLHFCCILLLWNDSIPVE